MQIIRREVVIVNAQLDETNKANEIFENELTVKETKIESMEKWNIEETRGIADEAQNKILKELLRIDVLGKEIAKYRTKQTQYISLCLRERGSEVQGSDQEFADDNTEGDDKYSSS